METKTFTEKSLNELQLHVLENYDKTLRSVNKKQKYAQLSLKFSFLSEFFQIKQVFINKSTFIKFRKITILSSFKR